MSSSRQSLRTKNIRTQFMYTYKQQKKCYINTCILLQATILCALPSSDTQNNFTNALFSSYNSYYVRKIIPKIVHDLILEMISSRSFTVFPLAAVACLVLFFLRRNWKLCVDVNKIVDGLCMYYTLCMLFILFILFVLPFLVCCTVFFSSSSSSSSQLMFVCGILLYSM